jgi:drug/metabolite transporter (DMT)-like permease
MTAGRGAVPRQVYAFLAVGLVAASQSGNIIRIGDAHPTVIAAWRLALAAVLLAPLAGRKLGKLRALSLVDVGLLLLSGLALALHFFAWIAAVQLTTVANAAIFFAVNPVITVTAAHLVFGERVTRRLVASIALGVLGVAVLGGSDLSLSPEQLPGDGAAVLCSVLFTVYFLLGKRLRRRLPTATYVSAIYGVAAAFAFAAVGFLGQPVLDHSPRNWICFALMALVPTLVGHTSFNNAIKFIDAGRISAATLSEPLLAGLVAYFAWNEPITAGTAAGYALISASVLVLVSDKEALLTTDGAPPTGGGCPTS